MHKSDPAEDPLLEESVDSLHRSNALTKRRNRRGKAVVDQICNPEQNCSEPDLGGFDINKVNLKLVFLILLAYISAGGLCFYMVRYHIKGSKTDAIVDAIYLCIVTMTTVGYGDLVPDSTIAKVLACVFVFVGMGLVGLILSKAADNIVENHEIILVKALHMRDKCSTIEIVKEVESNRSKYKFLTNLVLLVALIFVGTMFLYKREGLDLFDAFYCVCVTVTTLGYGDESFSTREGRIFAIFWILMSTICLAHFFYSLADLYTEGRRKSTIQWVLSKKFTDSDLEAADLDHDKVVSAGEFVVYKLKEMGKISEEDISMVMEMFKILDVDHSGTISKGDLQAYLQSSNP